MKYTLVPSVIASSQSELDMRLKKIKPLKPKLIHLDVMDGLFVKHTSLEFDVALPKGKYEAHLMLTNPHGWIVKNSSFVSSIIIHYESNVHLHDIIKEIKKKKKKIGLAINPDTPVEDIVQYLPHIHKVLVMTVRPGKYGSQFLPKTLKKIQFLRDQSSDLVIEVDGGMMPDTIIECQEAGANQFVVGSYLQQARDVKKAWKTLEKATKF